MRWLLRCLKWLARGPAWVVLVPGFAFGGSLSMLLESDVDRPGGEEVVEISFASMVDLHSNSQSDFGFTDLPISAGWSIAGFAFDGVNYHLVVESDDDAPGGDEVYVATFASLADVRSNTPEGGEYSAIDVGSNFGIRGFTYGDGLYHFLLESNEDQAAGEEVYLLSYASLADILSHTPFGGGFTDISISTGWSIAAFVYDGGGYHLVVESDSDGSAGGEVYVASFASIADVHSNTTCGGGYTAMDVGGDFGIRGLAGGTLFEDGFDFGDTLGWSRTEP